MPAVVLLANAGGIAKARRSFIGGAGRWLYVGKNSTERRRVTEALGLERRFRLGDRFHETTEALRQPFLDLVAEVGKDQTDRLGWWSSSLSWKDPSSDLFLLCSQLVLSSTLLRESRNTPEALVLLIEDPWLYEQLRLNFRDERNVRFGGSVLGKLLGLKLQRLVLGIMKRARYVARSLLEGRKLAKAYQGKTPFSAQRHIALYSLPQARTLEGEGGWHDPYLPGLEKILEKTGSEHFRFGPPAVFGFSGALGRRRGYFWPLALNISFADFVRAFPTRWKAKLPKSPTLEGNRVEKLLEREWWWDAGFASWMHFRLFFSSLKRMLAASQVRTVIFPWENQPWEKLLVQACRESGVKTIGYQHATVPRLLLAHFHGRGEAPSLPLPDRIFSAGQFTLKELELGGNPPEKLRLAGSLRYRAGTSAPETPATAQPPLKQILLALPLEPNALRTFLHALKAAFPDGGNSDGLTFIGKLHPVFPYPKEPIQQIFPCRYVDGTFADAIRDCGTVLFDSTTAGFEAWALGRNLLRFRPELLVDYNPCEVLAPHEVPVCNEDNLRELLLASVRGQRSAAPSSDRIKEAQDLLMGPVDPKSWLDEIGASHAR